jgi:hypothetical protein
MRVHIVSCGFVTANSQGFLAPILRLRKRLADQGIAIRIFLNCGEAAADCDVLIVESAALRDGWHDGSSLRALETVSRLNPNVAYFDIQDSTGTIQTAALDCVALYFKNQLLRDRSLYAQPYYGGRLYTDFYHRTAGVMDPVPQQSDRITDPGRRAKLRLSWNSAFADYGVGGILRRAAYARLNLPLLLRHPGGFTPPRALRPVDLGFRMTMSYTRPTVTYQRAEAARRLHLGREPRLSRPAFMRELARTKVVLSPFGWGEINLRDFEACIAGAALLKPDMSHLETWPDLYQPDTYIAFRWDFTDLAEQAARAVSDDQWRISVAERAQGAYRNAVASDQGDERFCERFAALMRSVVEARQPGTSRAVSH